MPLRDHFRSPLDDVRHWEGFYATWPVMIVASLRSKLPQHYFAEPRVHPGSSAEIDVATFENEGNRGSRTPDGNGVATAVWSPPRPTFTIITDLDSQDVYEVRVYDEKRHSRLVAAIEIVSPANKDRPQHRAAFASKCAGLLQEQVSVLIIDVVTSRTKNLYGELLELIGHEDPDVIPEPPPLYAAACRLTKHKNEWFFESWTQSLKMERNLPTMPLWLSDDLAVPLELEESYEQSCELLNLP